MSEPDRQDMAGQEKGGRGGGLRVCLLTPGTGHWYCGSCMRDAVLARALRRAGHEAVTAQLYLPGVVEGPVEQTGPLFFGGLNVYLQQRWGLFRRTPGWVDRLLDWPGLLRWASRFGGMTRARDLGAMTVSMLMGPRGRQAKELSRLLDWMKRAERFEVVCLSNAMLMGLARPIVEVLGVPVVVFLQGEEGFIDALVQPYRSQAWEMMANGARHVSKFVAVSRTYGRRMAGRLRLREGQWVVVHNGIDVSDLSPGRPGGQPVIGYLARMHRSKGLDLLVEAFIELERTGRSQGAQLWVAGAQTRQDRRYVQQQQRRLAAAGCLGRVRFCPNVSRAEKVALLQQMSVLSVPAQGESFGLYVLEALACGVPVVLPDDGAFGELLEATGGGLLCRAGDASDLAGKLAQLLVDEEKRQALGQAGRRAVLGRYTDAHMAEQVAGVLAEVVGDRGRSSGPAWPGGGR